MKKSILKIIGIVLILFIIVFIAIKIYHFIVFNKIYKAVENFRAEKNRYYAVEVTQGEELSRKEEIALTENAFKYLKHKRNSDMHCEWKNLQTNEEYTINIDKKEIYQSGLSKYKGRSLSNIPQSLQLFEKSIKSKLNKTLAIRSITLTKYENKKCYKMVTDTETIIIDRENYLPMYSFIKVLNKDKEGNNKVEMKYEFEVGNVTEEDVALPDLTDYTIVE